MALCGKLLDVPNARNAVAAAVAVVVEVGVAGEEIDGLRDSARWGHSVQTLSSAVRGLHLRVLNM
jgi:hypothetical protein